MYATLSPSGYTEWSEMYGLSLPVPKEPGFAFVLFGPLRWLYGGFRCLI